MSKLLRFLRPFATRRVAAFGLLVVVIMPVVITVPVVITMLVVVTMPVRETTITTRLSAPLVRTFLSC